MYLVKTPLFIQKFYDTLTWSIDDPDSLFLTFDDGPHPETTPWVLDCLSSFDAKATFFCLGEQAEKHPDLILKIKKQGHTLGNHSYSHPSGWTTNTATYLDDVKKCDQILKSTLFRPPYGRLKPSQLKQLASTYQIVMWDIMCGDFEASLTNEKCYNNISSNAKPGSIILLHDSLQSISKLSYVLPRVLETFSEKGFNFKSIHA